MVKILNVVSAFRRACTIQSYSHFKIWVNLCSLRKTLQTITSSSTPYQREMEMEVMAIELALSKIFVLGRNEDRQVVLTLLVTIGQSGLTLLLT